MIWFGVTPEGERLRMPAPVSARMNRAENAPADGFEGVSPMERSGRIFTALLGYGAGGGLIFDGIVDEQRETCGTVAALFLAARSRAALLLDNEAVPQVYSAPSLPVLFARHAAPYGFSGFSGSGRAFPGELTVEKGMSEWQVLETFCNRFLKIRPRAESACSTLRGRARRAACPFPIGTGSRTPPCGGTGITMHCFPSCGCRRTRRRSPPCSGTKRPRRWGSGADACCPRIKMRNRRSPPPEKNLFRSR